jgi:hypothetical protein
MNGNEEIEHDNSQSVAGSDTGVTLYRTQTKH